MPTKKTAAQPAPRIDRARRPATLGAKDIASVDYANSRATTNPVRTFSQSIPRISDAEKEKVYRSCGVLFKGINRKARDAIRKGFVVAPDIENRDDALKLNGIAREWMRRTAYRPKAIQALREMFVFGDGFLELGFAEPKGTPADKEPTKKAAIAAVYNVDPFSLLPVKDPDTGDIMAYLALESGTKVPANVFDPIQPSSTQSARSVRDLDRQAVKAWALGQKPLPKGVYAIHPKRIQHFQVNSLREHPDGLGISVIEPAYVNAVAKLAGDNAAGDVLEWYSKGFFTLQIDYATPEELQKALDQIEAAKQARKNYFVGSERSKFDIKSPSIANIQQFYDNFYIELAAALEMPTMVLMGVQKGTVTGSGTDLTEYYDDVHAFQTLLLDAPMLEVMRRVLGREDINLEWVPLFVDKQTEADVAFKRAQASSQLYGSRVLSRRESIRFLRNGELPNPDDVPEDYAPVGQKGATPPTSVAQSREDRATYLRKLGEEILREQEEIED